MMAANVTPTARKRHHPCSACCQGMSCVADVDGTRLWPPRLAFVASVAGSCPEADVPAVSGTLSVFGDEWGDPPAPENEGLGPNECADLQEFGCDPAWTGMCACYYRWSIPDADVPTCGPYISDVILQCLSEGRHPRTFGCPHKNRHTRMWYGQIIVQRARELPTPLGQCFIITDLGDPPTCLEKQCKMQDCADCTWKFVDIGCGNDPPADRCCPTCPPCYDCPSHTATRCAAEGSCCGEDGCEECTCPTDPPCTGDCDQCTHCIEDLAGSTPTVDPSCPVQCGGFTAIKYHFWHLSCTAPEEALGCDMTSCPPDDDDTGDFYLEMYCSDMAGNGDFLEVACL